MIWTSDWTDTNAFANGHVPGERIGQTIKINFTSNTLAKNINYKFQQQNSEVNNY